jgi:hypothetical protein
MAAGFLEFHLRQGGMTELMLHGRAKSPIRGRGFLLILSRVTNG